MGIRCLTYFLNFFNREEKLTKWTRLRPWTEKCFNILFPIPMQHQDMWWAIWPTWLRGWFYADYCIGRWSLMRKVSKKRKRVWGFVEADKQRNHILIYRSCEHEWTVSHTVKGGSSEISSFFNAKVCVLDGVGSS